jgi:hypothetical protein
MWCDLTKLASTEPHEVPGSLGRDTQAEGLIGAMASADGGIAAYRDTCGWAPALDAPARVSFRSRAGLSQDPGSTLQLERYAQDPKELDQFFSRREVPSSTRVADLRPLHWRLVGGRVHQLINRRSALYLYRGRSDEILLCEMYVGDIAELPSGGLLREN